MYAIIFIMDLTIKEQIQVYMGREKISQTDLAKKLGITRATVCNFFAKDDAKLSDLERYANAIGCTIQIDLIPVIVNRDRQG